MKKFTIIILLFCQIIHVSGEKISPQMWVKDPSDLTFTKVPSKNEFTFFILRGKSQGYQIEVSLNKEGTALPEKNYYTKPDAKGNFSFKVYFPYGPGEYKANVLVKKSAKSDTFWILSEFKLNSKKNKGHYTVPFQYYFSEGHKSRNYFQLEPVEFNNRYDFLLKGVSSCKRISYHVKQLKSDKKFKVSALSLSGNRHSCRIPAKHGPGLYEITAYGEYPDDTGSISIIGHLILKASAALPGDYNYDTVVSQGKKNAAQTITIDPVAKNWPYELEITGQSKIRNIWLTSAKDGYFCDEFPEMKKNGVFKFRHLLRHGPGKYFIYIYGTETPGIIDNEPYYEFEINARKKIPAGYGKPADISYHYGAQNYRLRLGVIDSETDSLLKINGRTTYDIIVLELSNSSAGLSEYAYEAGYIHNNRFSWKVRPPYGKGKYIIKVFGYPGTDGNFRNHCADFTVNFKSGFLPEKKYLNKEMVQFIRKNIGKRVRNGDCEDLVKEFFAIYGAMWTPHDTVG
ncbi:MAG TPA: hypothetical protein VKS21_10495, partial [Spirochaetota bacterium]|nr:hypothetical protein [Spirochaetota bacterium]